MMTRVSFYILKSTDSAKRWEFACRLAEKAYHQGHQIYIHTNSIEDAKKLDRALWEFRADSFVPHQIKDDEAEHSPIMIGATTHSPKMMDIMINLGDEQPLFFSQFKRVLEVIDADETVKRTGRQRYQFYKHRGYELENLTI